MAIVAPEKVGYFATPTPGYGNGDNVLGYAAEPVFGTPHGFYSTTQSVAITTATPGAIIVYTTNGSTPTVDANLNVTNGTLYTGPLSISSTTKGNGGRRFYLSLIIGQNPRVIIFYVFTK